MHVVFFSICFCLMISMAHADMIENPQIKKIRSGLSPRQVKSILTQEKLRTYRAMTENEFSYTYNVDIDKNVVPVTFYFLDKKLTHWVAHDRPENVRQYVSEFASSGDYPNIDKAIISVLNRLPEDVFMAITDRRRPVVFLVNITTGIARFANSIEFTMRPSDPPTFADGFYLVRLGDDLNTPNNVEAIEGVLFHELAHRYLEHLHKGHLNCETEREANRQVKAWGFGQEYAKASEVFGAKHKSDSPCNDLPEEGGKVK